MTNNTLPKGQWVKWENPEGCVNFGIIQDNPTERKDGVKVYPITTLDGSKTAVGIDKLIKVPHMRKGAKLSKKKEREMRKEMSESRIEKKQTVSKDEEILELRSKLKELSSKFNALVHDYDELKKLCEEFENNNSELANQLNRLSKDKVIHDIKQAIGQCLQENPENKMLHVKHLLDCLYKIAGI